MGNDESLLVETTGLTKTFGSGAKEVTAVKDVDLEVKEDTIISLVGQSGSGKTTVARMLLLLIEPTEGEIYYRGEGTKGYGRRDRLKYWRNVQGIFQDPYASFNQFFKVRKILKDCYKLFDSAPPESVQDRQIKGALEYVNLAPDDVLDKYPFEMSGGQRQRIMISRAFILNPKLLIADEPTSMIDACSRSNILNSLLNLKAEQEITINFITHDMGLAYYVSDDLLIMKDGEIVERGDVVRVVEEPRHPYTKQLLQDVPTLEEEWV
ncbi:MAG: ABC transporter ATP-binding protein [Candidatus Acetothermia bacterium]